MSLKVQFLIHFEIIYHNIPEIVEDPTGWAVARPRTAVTRAQARVVTVSSPGTTVTRGLITTVLFMIVSSQIYRLNIMVVRNIIIISLISLATIPQFAQFIR